MVPDVSRHYKTPADSLTVMHEIVLPNDTNIFGNLMGGRLMHWMDICAAIAAQKHSHQLGVTAAVNNVSFEHPIRLGDTVVLEARVVRAFRTSMEVYIEVFAENPPQDRRYKSNEAFFTFVAIDKEGRPVPVPQVKPVTTRDKELYDLALIRRQLKLLAAGKRALHELPELHRRFEQWMSGEQAGF